MSKFREGMLVVIIGENNEILRGTVKTVYDPLKVATVELPDGSLGKVKFSDMGIVEESQSVEETPEVKAEVQEGAKVITKDQFIEALEQVTSPEGMLGDKVTEVDPISLVVKGATVMIVGTMIAEKLFQDKEEIKITKDQLRQEIAKNTTPSAIAESTDGEMSKRQVLPIALLSLLVLSRLINIFFDDSENA